MKIIFTAALLLLSITMPLHAEDKIGVLLMHGKWGTSSENSPIGGLVDFLGYEGFLVSAPDMPWSRERGLDKSYKDSMLEINEHVKDLRDKGATRIVVGGHSMGANAALGYAARYEGVAGVLAIAPGHIPEIKGFQRKMENDWRRAKHMVDNGKGQDISEFKDVNQGRQTEKTIQASIYLSWFDPQGSAVMPKNTANLKSDTPLLWIIGDEDHMFDRGKDYAFNNVPSHQKNLYVVVNGGHKSTPDEGKNEIIDWLKNL